MKEPTNHLIKTYLEKTEKYLNENLIPFWSAKAVEPNFGGFQTNYDRNGNRTEVTEKSFLAQCRCIFTISHAMRLGFNWPNGKAAVKQGLDFLFKYFHDKIYDGYYWIVEEDGQVKDDNKIIYGHSFLIYGLAEYALLTGDEAIKKEAVRMFDFLQKRIADKKHGGFFEHFDRQFNLKKSHKDFPVHKSLDVHMHLMEAFTTLYELTGEERHKNALLEINELIFDKMVDPDTGTGMSMFTQDWTPIPNVELETVWGRDRFDENGKGTDTTSYGHNIELAWLYMHALDILGIPHKNHLNRVIPIFEHTYLNGVDWKHGGIYVEGKNKGAVTEPTKEFWQQAEAMVGFLDAYQLTGDEKYFTAFTNVHDFVFDKMINWEQGDWYALLKEDGTIVWDYMGTSWKVLYHTVRGTCLVTKKLKQLIEKQ
ncbi:AGE family epimerase/isomerase [Saprospiraceae bacterium]|nr:AGE family epimerase/isomerase [Saprospiraceae bacterium]MDC3219951.1 AGE family epimerase/isomerase [Saprospiraceae bacterium]MDC3253391.1 AGE family epimerase/isomerase [bacterium]